MCRLKTILSHAHAPVLKIRHPVDMNELIAIYLLGHYHITQNRGMCFSIFKKKLAEAHKLIRYLNGVAVWTTFMYIG